MSTPIQNRLVGTIIVAAAAIIFLPDIFDGEKKAYQALFEPIPSAPQTDKVDVKIDFPEEKFIDLTTSKPLSEENAVDEQLTTNVQPVAKTPEQIPDTKTVNVATAKPKVKLAPITPKKIVPVPKTVDKSVAYVIQLGSFKHKKNVEQLKTKLKARGYTVFTKPIKTAAGNLTKVFVGPQVNKKSLQKMLPELKKITGVQGRVAIYQPID